MPTLTMTRRLRAAPSVVFEALTHPDQIARWFGSGAPDTKDIEADARPGGRYHFGFTGMNGNRMDVRGVYEEVRAPERLVFNWAWDFDPEHVSTVTIDLSPDGEGTLLSLTHAGFHDDEALAGHREGWTFGLDRLSQTVETVSA